MKNFKNKAKKVAEIAERILLVGVGAGALYASIFNNPISIRYTALGLGVLCIIAGLVPMITAYAKTVWNQK